MNIAIVCGDQKIVFVPRYNGDWIRLAQGSSYQPKRSRIATPIAMTRIVGSLKRCRGSENVVAFHADPDTFTLIESGFKF